MNIALSASASLSDAELLIEVARLAHGERRAIVQLVAALVEIDRRQLYLREGCSSLYVYCTRVLRLSEHAAHGRIEAIRAAQRFPIVLDLLERGDLTLTSLCLLAPVVNEANHREVYERARHRTKREVEEIAASLRPKPDVRTMIRKLPEPPTTASTPHTAPAGVSAPPPTPTIRDAPKPTVVQALAPERYMLQVTVSRATRDKLQRAGSDVALGPDWRRRDHARSCARSATDEPRAAKVCCGSEPAGERHGYIDIASHPSDRATVSMEARRRSMRVHRCAGAMRRERIPRVSSRATVCRWW
jgi:hypothetical protein